MADAAGETGVRGEPHAVGLGQGGDLAGSGDAPAAGQVRLHDVQQAVLRELVEAVQQEERLAASQRDRGLRPDPRVTLDVVRVHGFLEEAQCPGRGATCARAVPARRALANAAIGLEVRRVSKRERERAAREALAAVGLADFETAYPAQLSQGMRQRVALARVFAVKPETLLLDEPFSALDPQTRIAVQDAFLGLWQERRTSVVLVTHDLSEAITLADRVVVMSRRPGRLKADHRIDLPRPRSAAELRSTPAFHALYERIWLDLKDEVMAADSELLQSGTR
jgi:ABC-type dipeptide/oligopeptide/nickel transport system ATPase subunit